MILITGDVHGFKHFLKMGSSELIKLTKNDFIIICGDLGAIFCEDESEKMINVYSYFPFTILFVDGDHENFDLLKKYPEEQWHGGIIHRISDNLIHLMRGQVYEIEGKSFFTFGGGLSYDKESRELHVNWWPQELPDKNEMEKAKTNLKRFDYKVDYVVTHDCPTHLLREVKEYSHKLQSYGIKKTELNDFLDEISDKLIFNEWFFGHYHIDHVFGDYTCVFNDILRI